MKIPQVVNRYNLYRKGTKLVGLTGEVELPAVTMVTDTLEGAGTGGNMDVPVIGLTENMDIQIPFMSLTKDLFSLANPGEAEDLTLRGAIQGTDPATGKISYTSIAISMRGTVKEITPGTVKSGGRMESSVTMTLSYYKIALDGETVLEIDKLNNVFVVNGDDVLKEVRDMC
ncbi:MAG TPA: phage major tail tube protein [Candidatus Lachnoclostridium avicola]|nr:phage major tail tube protein [Candidatus Lachnoclostridium avicola]